MDNEALLKLFDHPGRRETAGLRHGGTIVRLGLRRAAQIEPHPNHPGQKDRGHEPRKQEPMAHRSGTSMRLPVDDAEYQFQVLC